MAKSKIVADGITFDDVLLLPAKSDFVQTKLPKSKRVVKLLIEKAARPRAKNSKPLSSALMSAPIADLPIFLPSVSSI